MSDNINILLPTRNRSELASKSIKSLCDNASRRESLRFHLGVDYDDPLSLKYSYYNSGNVYIHIFPPIGYKNLHIYYNTLCSFALQFEGWVLLWNDDLTMLTPNWDDIVREYNDQFVVISPVVKNTPQFDCLFPIIPTKWFYITSRLSNNTHTDTWIEMIAKSLNILRKEPRIELFHDRADFTGNNMDDTFNNRVYNMQEFDVQQPERIAEVELLKRRLNL